MGLKEILFGDSPQDIYRDTIQPQIDRNRADWNAWQSDVQDAMAASGYDFFAPKTTTSDSLSQTVFNRFSRPEVLKDYKNIEGLMRGMMEQRLGMGASLPPGYEQRAIAAANQAYAGAEQAARNAAAGRGLSGGQAYASQIPIQSARAGKIADIRANTPLLERQLVDQDIATAAGLTDRFGKGTRESGRSTTTGQQTTTGPADVREFLAYQQMLQPFQAPYVNVPGRQGIAGDLAGLAMQFFMPGSGGFPGGGGGQAPMTMPAPGSAPLTQPLY